MTDPRDIYQAQLRADIYEGWQAGNRNMLAILATGGGKSVVVSQIILDGHQQGLTECVIAHRNELVGQMSLHVARRGIRHRVIASSKSVGHIIAEHRREFNGQSFINPDARCSVVSVDTLIARKDALEGWAKQVTRWTVDECFIAGTLIATPFGDRPIETIRVGDNVIAFDEKYGVFAERKVLSLFKNPAPLTMFDIAINGVHVRCTAGHPFWTDRGWVEAKDLTTDDKVLCRMHGMQHTISIDERSPNLSLEENRYGVLQETMRICISNQTRKETGTETAEDQRMPGLFADAYTTERKNMLTGMSIKNIIRNDGTNQPSVCVQTNDAQQSDEIRCITREDVSNTSFDETQATDTRWQRQADTITGTKIDRNVNGVWFHSSICDSDGFQEGSRSGEQLQTGHGTPDVENCNRSGRNQSFISLATGTGCDERCVSSMCRVESIEIYQSTDIGRAGDGHVYNIEVDDFHTYIANGIVVHNCHHVLSQNKWGKAVTMFPNAYGLGVTATPKRADGMGLGRHHDGVFDAMVLGPSMRELIDMGALSDYEIAIPESDFQIDDADLAPSGDWSNKKMREASKRSHIVGDVVIEYQKRAAGKRAICFATDVETAGEMAQRFNEAGITAAAVSAKTPDDVRNDFIRRFRDGRITVLVNVDLFGEGFDVPAVEVVIMARPTASLAVYLQQCLDTNTEILTTRGWMNHCDIHPTDTVATFNQRSEIVEWLPINTIVKRELGDEKMYAIKSPHLDVRVTGGHDMIVRSASGTAKNWVKQPSELVAARKGLFRIPVSARQTIEDNTLSDDEIRFIGWYLTDGTIGSNNQVVISQSASKPHHCDMIRSMLDGCGFGFSEHRIKRTGEYAAHADNIMFAVSHGKHPLRGERKGLRGWIALTEWLNKSVPEIFNTLSERQFDILIEAMDLGDGNNNTNSISWNRATITLACGTNAIMADRIQQLAVVRGWRCNLGVRNYTGADWYMVMLKKITTTTIAGRGVPDGSVGGKKKYTRSRFEISPTDPSELVWCVENDNGTIFTRRNGKVAIVGNCGRALRALKGKDYGLIIDHVSNWKRHGFPDKQHVWSLDRRDKRAKRDPDPEIEDLTGCRSCSRPYLRVLPACPYCGAEIPVPKGGARSLDQVDGDLMLLDRTMLAEMRAAVQLEAPANVGERVGFAAGRIAGLGATNRQMERIQAQQRLQAAIEQWGGVQRHIGRSDSESYRRFYLATGVDVLTALTQDRQDMERLAQVVEGWYA